LTLTLIAPPSALQAQEPAGTIGPDLVLHDLFETQKWGQVDGITAYSIGTEICNLGDENANWVDNTPDHPVIAQNMYRLKDGRFEQIGMSWLKHGFFAVNGSACGNCQFPGFGGDLLGPFCSDPYDSDLNGQQGSFGTGGLGPRSEVNAATGEFLFPYGSQGQTGDAIYKRLQVHNVDLEPAMNEGALYFIEGQYVTRDDALAGNKNNNAAYRQVRVNDLLNLVMEGPTQPGTTAIHAWQEQDPEVDLVDIEIDQDGLMTLGARVTAIDVGLWRYEYALHNMNSDRSGQAFQIPVPEGVTVSNAGFHDVDYHSGEPYDLTDWTPTTPGAGGGMMRWETTPFDQDENANALRWGTLYNFRFDADAPPGPVSASIDLFRPGSPAAVTAMTLGPDTGASCGGVFSVDFSQTPLVRGQIAELTVTGVNSGETVRFLASPAGRGCALCPQPIGGLCLDLLAPLQPLGAAVADAGGTAVFSIPVPADVQLTEITTQAVVQRGIGGTDSVKSEPITAPVLDP